MRLQEVVLTKFLLQLLDAIILADKVSMLKTTPLGVRKEADAKMTLEDTIEVLKEPLNLSETLKQIFIDALNLKNIEGFNKQYIQTIGQARNRNALLIYAGKLQSLSDKEAAINTLRDFATAILQGNAKYRNWRYTITPGSHLEQIFTTLDNQGKLTVRDELLKKWQEGKKIAFEQLVKSSQTQP